MRQFQLYIRPFSLEMLDDFGEEDNVELSTDLLNLPCNLGHAEEESCNKSGSSEVDRGTSASKITAAQSDPSTGSLCLWFLVIP